MTHRFVNDLQAGDFLEDEIYLISSKDLRTTAQGKLYIHAILVDRTGQLVARQWQASESGFQDMPEGGFMYFKGRVENYKGNKQFIIDAMRAAEPTAYDVADYMASTSQDIDQMWQRLIEILSQIKHADLKDLVNEFLADEKLMTKVRKAPAAVVMHHAYIGGLLEHTLNLLELALKTIPLYPKLSLDLVLAGLFLHDIGKAEELTYATSFAYSDQGQLLGHIVQATIWIEQKAASVAQKRNKPFPDEVKWVLQHIILSHHGQYEFGSPKLPAIPEAIAIHFLDNLDAKVNTYLSAIESDRDSETHWTNYQRLLGTKILKLDVMNTRSL